MLTEGKENLVSTDWNNIRDLKLKNEAEILNILHIISSAFATSSNYEFHNVELTNSSGYHTETTESSIYFEYTSIIKNIECTGCIDYCRGEYHIGIAVEYSELIKLTKLPENIFEKFNNLDLVTETKHKILLNNDGIQLICYEREYDNKYDNINKLRCLLDDSVYMLDCILLELDNIDIDLVERYSGNFKQPIHPSLIAKNIEIYEFYKDIKDGINDIFYVKHPILGVSIQKLDETDRIRIDSVHTDDIIFNVSPNVITGIQAAYEVEYNENIRFLINSEGICDKIWLKFKEPKYVGVNGVYTEEPVDTILLGEIKNNNIIPDITGKPEYENMCFVHILDVNYENRKFIMQL